MCGGDEFKVRKLVSSHLNESENIRTDYINERPLHSIGEQQVLFKPILSWNKVPIIRSDDNGTQKTKFTMEETVEELKAKYNTYIFNRKHLPGLQNEFPGLKYDQYTDILKAKKLGIDRKISDIKIQLDTAEKELNNIINDSFISYYKKHVMELKLKYPELSEYLYIDMLRASWVKMYKPIMDELTVKIQKLTTELDTLSK